MSILSGVSDFFGLDMGTSGLRIVQLSGSGPVKSLVRYASAPLDLKVSQSDSKADQQKVLQVLKDVLEQSRITTKNVAVGIPSQRVFTTVVDIDRMPLNDLAKSIKYQADALIPTPIADSKIDWALIGDSPVDKTKVEILLTSVANDYVEKRLDLLESLGLNVIALEPDNLAVARALTAGENAMGQIVLDMGLLTTDLVVMLNGAPRLIRSIPTGSQALVSAAVQNLNIDAEQAEQFVFKFGMSTNKLEGQIQQAIMGTIDVLLTEVDKSMKYFLSRYQGTKIDRIIVTGAASALPEFPLYMANKFKVSVEIGNTWRNVAFAPQMQNELLAVSNHFGVAAGLAERIE